MLSSATSGEVRITDPTTGGQKGVKPERFDLIPWDALEEVARVYGIGASKYDDDNWLKGYRWRLSLGALMRHVARFMLGEDRDPETGCLHLAHAAWHCLTVITFFMRSLGTDDRAPPKPVLGRLGTLTPAHRGSFEVGDTVRIKLGTQHGNVGRIKQLMADVVEVEVPDEPYTFMYYRTDVEFVSRGAGSGAV